MRGLVWELPWADIGKVALVGTAWAVAWTTEMWMNWLGW